MFSGAETKKKCLVLIAHGSKDPTWILPFEKLAQDLKSEYGQARVHLAFMELSSPTLLDVAGRIAKSGITSFHLLPLFMSRGSHFAHDLPAQVEEAQLRFPDLKITLLPPIGQNPEFFRFIHKITRRYVD